MAELYCETISPLLILLVSVSDLFFLRILETAGQAFQSVHLLSRTAQLNILLGITRLLAAFALVSFFSKARSCILVFFVPCEYSSLCLGRDSPRSSLTRLSRLAVYRIKPEIVEGLYFSVSLSAQTVYNDIDKTMLARLSTLSQLQGSMQLPTVLIEVAFVPVRSLLAAAYAKFFQHGASGLRGSMGFAKRLVPLAGTYGVAASVGLFLFAPVVPYVLGDEYAGAVEALRWLALLPFLKSLHHFAADTLTGAGFQGLRSAIQVAVAVFNVFGEPLVNSSVLLEGSSLVRVWLQMHF